MSIVLNTESKQYPNFEGISVVNFPSKKGKDCWGKRYKHILKVIKTPYIIPVLEDFVLQERFNGNELISKTIEWMDKNPGIVQEGKLSFLQEINEESNPVCVIVGP